MMPIKSKAIIMKKLLLSLFLLLSLAMPASAQINMAPLGPSSSGGGGVPNTLNSASDPTTINDSTQGYQVGSLWQNSATGRVWVARSVAVGAAVWDGLASTDFIGYIAGNWYMPYRIGQLTSAVPAAGNTIFLVPAVVRERCTLSNLAARVSTGGGRQRAICYL